MRQKIAAHSENQPKPTKPGSTKNQEKRLEKLEGILANLRRGKNVQNRQLKTWLTEEEYIGFEQEWVDQKALREERKNKPQETSDYEQLVHKAVFAENRAIAFSSEGKKVGAKALSTEAESLFEQAIEYLHEILTSNPSLQIWIDRNVDFTPGNEPSLDSVGIPRVVTTRSMEKVGDGLFGAEMKKIDVKIEVVERAIDAL